MSRLKMTTNLALIGEREEDDDADSSLSVVLHDQAHFLRALSHLLESRQIQANAHALLLDFIHDKYRNFTERALCNRINIGVDDWSIDDYDVLIRCKLEKEIDHLYEDLGYESAQMASMVDRADMGILVEDDNLVYGEVNVKDFFTILQTATKLYNPVYSSGIFYDVGSGSGKAVLTARLGFDFEHCIGIEILPSLHRMAVEVKNRFENRTRRNTTQKLDKLGDKEVPSLPLKPAHDKIDFFCEDMMNFDFKWSDASVVFLHSTCFGADLLKAIFTKAEEMKESSILITCRAIDTTCFELVNQAQQTASWGRGDVFVYQRL